MDRRRFIRLAGGGTLAAAAGLAGCSPELPAAALADWAGPPAEADLRRWALGHAILAPNSHNRQPWIADLRTPDSIVLFVDRERMLPMTDPWMRQIVVSQGTFLESLALALRQRGQTPRIELFPAGEFAPRSVDDRPVARVTWTAGGAPDPLFQQLLARHTAKVAYDTARPVAEATLAGLAAAVADPRVRYGFTVAPDRVAEFRTLCMESAMVELRTPRTVLESLQLTRVGPAEIARHRDGISVNGALARVAAAVGLFDRSTAPAEGSSAMDQMVSLYEQQSRSAMGFVWLTTPVVPGATRSAEVASGRAFLRLQLAAAAVGLQVHPMSQAPQEFDEMRPLYDRLHQRVAGRPASEEVVQMFCRVGYCAPQSHTPRRGVDAIVRT